MNRALIVPFHHYTPYYKGNYRLLFEYFKKQLALWGEEVDHIYMVDSQDYFYPGEAETFHTLHANISILKTHNFSHAETLKHAFDHVSEPMVAIIDMDTFVYKKGIFNKYFTLLETDVDVVSMVEAPSLGLVSRFAPYFCMLKTEKVRALGEIDFNPHPEMGHLDPLAKLSHDLIDRGVKWYSVPDDRATIQITKELSLINKRTMYSNSGIYHARNFNGGIHLVDSYLCDRENFERHIAVMPFEEVSRIFGWNVLIAKHVGGFEKLIDTIAEIVNKQGIASEDWNAYLDKFEDFHNYIKI